jgi:carbonic anhydrase
VSLEDLLAKNEQWAARQITADPEFFSRLKHGQRPRLLWIGCSDSRVPAEQILDCKPGDLFVHRNIANVVAYNDVNVAAVVEYAIEHLSIEDIVVCGHYGCGGVKAACEEKVIGGYIGDWLMITAWAKRWVEERLARDGGAPPAADEFLRLVVEENVGLQVKHLGSLSSVRASREKRRTIPRLHGWVYDIGTGRVRVIEHGGGGAAHLAGEA